MGGDQTASSLSALALTSRRSAFIPQIQVRLGPELRLSTLCGMLIAYSVHVHGSNGEFYILALCRGTCIPPASSHLGFSAWLGLNRRGWIPSRFPKVRHLRGGIVFGRATRPRPRKLTLLTDVFVPNGASRLAAISSMDGGLLHFPG